MSTKEPPPSSPRMGMPYSPKVLAVHLELLQYPILGRVIRMRMRDEIFSRSIITPSQFNAEVHEKAMRSQKRELVTRGLDEPVQDWEDRKAKCEEILTEFYYATNFAQADFLSIIESCLAERSTSEAPTVFPRFNPEIAPFNMLFAQGQMYEQLPTEQRAAVAHHLREIIVVLIKGMMSDQLPFISIAKHVMTTSDLKKIHSRRIGRGRIGGKAAGLMLAKRILSIVEPDDPPEFAERIRVPESCFLGADVFYDFLSENALLGYMNQKYRTYEENCQDYPSVAKRFLESKISPYYRDLLKKLLEQFGDGPLIVRSSSLLEDNFGIAFAGKYDSYFCPNQATPGENLEALCVAIKQVYASTLSPDALAYRQQRGLIDYDERMAILIQKVEGKRYGDYFFPQIAGVGFSHNPIVWNPRINRDEGFLRIVGGLGTRAVDRVDSDYARMVALSNPALRPMRTAQEVVQYSQRNLDVVNLASNNIETLPAKKAFELQLPGLKLMASLYQHGELQRLLYSGLAPLDGELILTFDGLLQNRDFVTCMRTVLKKLERQYKRAVDIEFTVEVDDRSPSSFTINILQCRQQSRRAQEAIDAAMPEHIPPGDMLFVSDQMVTTGVISDIRYAVYVDPEQYRFIGSDEIRVELAKAIGQLNVKLASECFILIGPGRWGSSNKELGVPVSYGDIFNTRALVEVALPMGEHPPEASYGTHFFQDLVESNIYPLPIYPGQRDGEFNFAFFREASNLLSEILPKRRSLVEHLKVIDLRRVGEGREMEIVMNAQQERAVGFLK